MQPSTCDERVHTNLQALTRLREQVPSAPQVRLRPVSTLLSGSKASTQRGRGLDFAELRHYVPGDDIRTMDWSATRRTGKPHVRTYSEERDRPVLLLVDQRSSMFFGSKIYTKSVIAAELAALLAWYTLASGDRAGAVLLSDKHQYLRPSRSPAALLRWLDKLAIINGSLNAQLPANRADSLFQGISRAASLIGHDYSVVLISDLHGWNQQCAQVIQILSQHNDVSCLHILDPLEQHFAIADPVVFSNGQQQQAVTPQDTSLIKSFSADRQQHLQQIQRQYAQLGIPLLPVTTAVSASRQWQALQRGYQR